MAFAVKFAFMCLIVGLVLRDYQVSSGIIEDPIISSIGKDSSENENSESIVDEKKHQTTENNYHNDHYITTKKPSILQGIAEKFGFGKPGPSKPPKKPLVDLQHFFKPQPVVTSTKTLVIEVTKRLTRHPVCIASKIGVPHCDSYHENEHHHSPNKVTYKENDDNKTEEIPKENGEELWVGDFKNDGIYIEPSASMKMSSDLATKLPEIIDGEGSEARSGRYLQFARETPAVPDVKSTIEDGEIDTFYESDETDEEGKYLFKKAETKVVTKTLWVTRVQKVTDYKVTATLVPENCIPSELNFPRCSYPHPDTLTWKNGEKKDNEPNSEE